MSWVDCFSNFNFSSVLWRSLDPEMDDGDEYAKLIRRMNSPRFCFSLSNVNY